MILPLRVVLFVCGILFSYFFGETLEKFIIEVVRFFIALEPDNAFLFNSIHMIILLVPLALFGLLVSISFSGELALSSRLWLVMGGIAAGIISFRIYQIWWVFRGAMGDDSDSWSESLSPEQLYFMEKLLPYIIVGIASSLVISIGEKETKKIEFYGLISAVSSFLWLFITHKIQNVSGIMQMGAAFIVTCLCGLAVAMAARRAREF